MPRSQADSQRPPTVCSNIVVIDDAHNLIDSILSLHTVSVSLAQLASIRLGLVTYYAKFKARFTGANGAYLWQLVLVVKGLAAFAEGWAKNELDGKGKGKRREGMVTANEVSSGLKGEGALDQINLLKLDEYLKNSRIAQKVSADGLTLRRSYQFGLAGR